MLPSKKSGLAQASMLFALLGLLFAGPARSEEAIEIGSRKLKFGEPYEAVLARFAADQPIPNTNRTAFYAPKAGLWFLFDQKRQLAVIYLSSGATDAVRGIRIGDPVSVVTQTTGAVPGADGIATHRDGGIVFAYRLSKAEQKVDGVFVIAADARLGPAGNSKALTDALCLFQIAMTPPRDLHKIACRRGRF